MVKVTKTHSKVTDAFFHIISYADANFDFGGGSWREITFTNLRWLKILKIVWVPWSEVVQLMSNIEGRKQTHSKTADVKSWLLLQANNSISHGQTCCGAVVNNDTLLERLQSEFSVRGTSLAWLQSYLAVRTQFVKLRLHQSPVAEPRFHQGFWPMLFAHYYSSFGDGTESVQ